MASRSIDAVALFQSRRWLFLPLSLAAMVGAFVFQTGFGRLDPTTETVATVLTIPLFWTLSGPLTRLFAARWVRTWLAPSAFFIYAGHFLFASTLLHLIAPHLSFEHGKLTVLVLIFVGLGIPFCVAAHWVGRKVAPRLIRVFDATL